MKNVLLLVHDDHGQEARLQCALDLVRALGGHLVCAHVTMPPAAVGALDGGIGQAMLVDIEVDREDRHRAAIEARLAHEDVPWTWIEATNTLCGALLDQADLADVIVVNRKLDDGSGEDMLGVASRLVVYANKPVLAVPQSARQMALGRVLVAWDGGAACAAAMRAAVPLLALASDVKVFMAADGSGESALTEPAEYLSRHGVHSEVEVVARDGRPADDLIAHEAARWEADLIVMGAYGRGRLLEAFGGVTKRMLAKAALPLFLAH